MSTSDKSVFEASPTGEEVNEVQTEPKVDQSEAGPLALLVGEGRKYKTEAELAKAYMNADEFISKLKEENLQLKERVASGKTLDDVLERINANRSEQGATTLSESKGVSADDIAKIVEQTITGRETARTREANQKKADQMLKAQFGEKAVEVYRASASTPAKAKAMSELAAVDPDAFMQLFKGDAYKGNPSDGSNTRGEAAMQHSSASPTQVGTKAYYDEMRRKDPTKFWASATQLEMHKNAEANPDKFWGRRR